jgi:hypothetical protein
MTQTLPRLLVVNTGAVDHDGAIKLLSAILADLPQLTGTSCIGKHRMFDSVIRNGHRYRDQERAQLTKAARVCAGCRVIGRCPSVTTVAVEVVPAPGRPAPPPGLLPAA